MGRQSIVGLLSQDYTVLHGHAIVIFRRMFSIANMSLETIISIKLYVRVVCINRSQIMYWYPNFIISMMYIMELQIANLRNVYRPETLLDLHTQS